MKPFRDIEDREYSPKEFSLLTGIPYRTLVRYDEKGYLVAGRTSTNRRFYTKEHYLQVYRGFRI